MTSKNKLDSFSDDQLKKELKRRKDLKDQEDYKKKMSEESRSICRYGCGQIGLKPCCCGVLCCNTPNCDGRYCWQCM